MIGEPLPSCTELPYGIPTVIVGETIRLTGHSANPVFHTVPAACRLVGVRDLPIGWVILDLQIANPDIEPEPTSPDAFLLRDRWAVRFASFGPNVRIPPNARFVAPIPGRLSWLYDVTGCGAYTC